MSDLFKPLSRKERKKAEKMGKFLREEDKISRRNSMLRGHCDWLESY